MRAVQNSVVQCTRAVTLCCLQPDNKPAKHGYSDPVSSVALGLVHKAAYLLRDAGKPASEIVMISLLFHSS